MTDNDLIKDFNVEKVGEATLYTWKERRPDDQIKWPVFTPETWETVPEDKKKVILDLACADIRQHFQSGQERVELSHKEKVRFQAVCADIECSGTSPETCGKYPERCSILRKVILGPWT